MNLAFIWHLGYRTDINIQCFTITSRARYYWTRRNWFREDGSICDTYSARFTGVPTATFCSCPDSNPWAGFPDWWTIRSSWFIYWNQMWSVDYLWFLLGVFNSDGNNYILVNNIIIIDVTVLFLVFCCSCCCGRSGYYDTVTDVSKKTTYCRWYVFFIIYIYVLNIYALKF